MKPLFAEQYKVSPAKYAGAGSGAGRAYFLGTHRRAAASDPRTATPVYSMCSVVGQAGYLKSWARPRSIPELKPSGHSAHFITRIGDRSRQVRIHKNHMAEFKAGRLHNRLHPVERKIDLRRGNHPVLCR